MYQQVLPQGCMYLLAVLLYLGLVPLTGAEPLGYFNKPNTIMHGETTFASIEIDQLQLEQCYFDACLLQILYGRGPGPEAHHLCVGPEQVELSCTPEHPYYKGVIQKVGTTPICVDIVEPGQVWVSSTAECTATDCVQLDSTFTSITHSRLVKEASAIGPLEVGGPMYQRPGLGCPVPRAYVPLFVNTTGFENATGEYFLLPDTSVTDFPSVTVELEEEGLALTTKVDIDDDLEDPEHFYNFTFEWSKRPQCCKDHHCTVDVKTKKFPNCTEDYTIMESIRVSKSIGEIDLYGYFSTGEIDCGSGFWRVTPFLEVGDDSVNFEMARPTNQEDIGEPWNQRKAAAVAKRIKEMQYALKNVVTRLGIKMKHNKQHGDDTLVAFGEIPIGIGRELAQVAILTKTDKDFREPYMLNRYFHPNIISTFDVTIGDNLYLIVQDHLTPLTNTPERGGMNTGVFKTLVHDTLLGIEYLHAHNVIHRDLKPGNIGYNNRTKAWQIADLDLTHQVGPNGLSWSEGVGTDGYMAPEVINVRNTGYTKAVDLYSLGQVMRRQMRYFEPHTPAETAFTEKAKILYEQLISVNPVERGTATEAFDFLFGNKQEEAAGVVTLSALNLA